jgi:hypothetical protein
MDFVRDLTLPAWTALENGIARSGVCLLARYSKRLKEGVMQDLAYIGLTILVFTVLYLIPRGVERFER